MTTHHGVKVETKSSGNGVNKRANSQNSSTRNTVVVEDDQNEDVCCNSTYIWSNVVSMYMVPLKIKLRASKVMETYAVLDSYSQGTFMDGQLPDEIQIFGRKTTNTVKILNGEATELTGVVEGLKVANGGRKTYQKER